MFADLDDPAPPAADSRIRHRVEVRTQDLVRVARRRRRMARGALLGALVLFVAAVGFLVCDHGSPRPAPVIARWSFAGHPTVAAQRAAVSALDRRFTGAGMEARAQLADGGVAVTATGPTPPSVAALRALTVPGRFELRPVIRNAAPGDQLRLGPALEGNGLVESASSDFDQGGQWEIRPVFKAGPDGIDRFNALAATCLAGAPTCPTRQLALVLDGQVLSAPTINAPSFERDQITIAGAYTQAEATRIAALLSAGPLPAPLQH